MKVAVEGCAHGELEKIYETIAFLENKEGFKVDLLLCCGDFQSTRNSDDLECMAVPPKYRSICSFYKYYSGEKTAPVLTIFIGGNHEASNYLSELAYGGWVAPNIYYLGYAGVVDVAGVRIAGLSGIYKGRDFKLGHFEKAPFSQHSMRSVYHIRNLETFRLKQLSGKIDIALSHDWPRGIYHHGNLKQLLRFKPFLQEDIKRNSLGSQPAEELLFHLKPSYWFSAHLHCKFSALIRHITDEDVPETSTKFLALDKCLPKRRFLQVLDIPHDEKKDICLEYDLQWLTILSLTNHLLSTKETCSHMPGPGGGGRWIFTPTQEEKDFVLKKFCGNLRIPLNFTPTVPAFNPAEESGRRAQQPYAQLNPQTVAFCDCLGVDDPIALLMKAEGSFNKPQFNPGSAIYPSEKDSSQEAEDINDQKNVGKSDAAKFSLKGMKLPSPKIELGNSPEELFPSQPDQSKAISIKLNDEKILSKPTEESNSTEPSLENPIVESRTPTSFDSGLCENEAPQRKKFKRRNEAIYNSVEEDDGL